nr:hypothetical protein bcere0006_55930 [Bacillus wiedmannii]
MEDTFFIWHKKHLAKELDANRNKKEEKVRPIFLIWLYQKNSYIYLM